MVKDEVSNAVISGLLDTAVVHSCLNCESWNGELCTKFNSIPPARIVVFSCGKDWRFDPPF
jgi:hypothetical protein